MLKFEYPEVEVLYINTLDVICSSNWSDDDETDYEDEL